MSDRAVSEKTLTDGSAGRESHELLTNGHLRPPTKESNPSESSAATSEPLPRASEPEAPRVSINQPRISLNAPRDGPFRVTSDESVSRIVFGFVTGYEYAMRGWKLLKKSPEYRPRGSPRWGLDTVQWSLSLPYFFMTVILIAASIPHEPLVRVLAIPLPVGFILLGIWLYASAIMYQFKLPTPIRLSSTPKGVVAPPLVYHIIEDVVAVDGGGKLRFRDALHDRFEASPRFRRMLWHLTNFWGLPTAFMGAILIALIFTVDKEVAYGLGWGVPTVWAAIWTVITIIWVKAELKLEYDKWETEGGGVRFGRSLSLPVSGWHLPEDEQKRGWMGRVKGWSSRYSRS
ncbi:MAG: hypothetical protein Q9227_009205 [Pyrenula ochraceoflavens]